MNKNKSILNTKIAELEGQGFFDTGLRGSGQISWENKRSNSYKLLETAKKQWLFHDVKLVVGARCRNFGAGSKFGVVAKENTEYKQIKSRCVEYVKPKL